MQEKLNQLQAKLESEPSLVEKLFALETPEEVQGFLKEQGIDFTLDEIELLRDSIIKSMEKGKDEELSDEALEGVAGGVAAVTPVWIHPSLPPILPIIPPRW